MASSVCKVLSCIIAEFVGLLVTIGGVVGEKRYNPQYKTVDKNGLPDIELCQDDEVGEQLWSCNAEFTGFAGWIGGRRHQDTIRTVLCGFTGYFLLFILQSFSQS